tara:strand:- start:3574 stop:4089 length:516 start_codon:yes stop_codon:yes gene_type:complete
MPKCYMMVGLPYSGKSTFVKNTDLFKKDDFVSISADQYIHKMAESVQKSYLEAFPHVFNAANQFASEALEQAALQGLNIVIDQHNVNAYSRESKLKLLLSDYEKIAVVMPTLSDEELKQRYQDRCEQRVPKSVYSTLSDLYTTPAFSEGFDRIVHVGFDDVVVEKESVYAD